MNKKTIVCKIKNKNVNQQQIINNTFYNNIDNTTNITDIVNKYFSEDNGFGKYKQSAIDLLQITIQLLDEYKIKYCLISGTLLGYIRPKKYIKLFKNNNILTIK